MEAVRLFSVLHLGVYKLSSCHASVIHYHAQGKWFRLGLCGIGTLFAQQEQVASLGRSEREGKERHTWYSWNPDQKSSQKNKENFSVEDTSLCILLCYRRV